MMPDSSKRGGVDAGMQGSGMQEGGAGGMWNVAGGGHDDQMSRVDSGGASQLWSGEGAGGHGGGAHVNEENDLHALSWMAPDFDLDELLR